MTSRGRAIGMALLICAATGAFATASASASGLTAVKCVEVESGKGNYNNSQCATPKSGGGSFDTVALPLNESTNIEGQATTSEHVVGSTEKPAVVTTITIGGSPATVVCGTDHILSGAKLTNLEEKVGEMKIHGTNIVITNEECHAFPKASPTKICSVQGVSPATPVGQIKTNPMTTTSGSEHSITVQPETGSVFTKFNVLASGGECFTKSNISVELTGKVKGVGNTETHSHITFEPATNGTEFKGNGGAVTVSATIQTFMEGKPEELVGVETF